MGCRHGVSMPRAVIPLLRDTSDAVFALERYEVSGVPSRMDSDCPCLWGDPRATDCPCQVATSMPTDPLGAGIEAGKMLILSEFDYPLQCSFTHVMSPMMRVKQCVWHSPQLFGSDEISTQ